MQNSRGKGSNNTQTVEQQVPWCLHLTSIPAIPYQCYLHVRESDITLPCTPPKSGQDRVRDGSICIFKYESALQFGSIYQFCFAKGEIVAIINVFRLSEQNLLDSVRPTTLNHSTLALSNSINKFGFFVEKLSLTNQTVAIPASSINFKCIHIPVKGSPFDLLFLFPTCLNIISFTYLCAFILHFSMTPTIS